MGQAVSASWSWAVLLSGALLSAGMAAALRPVQRPLVERPAMAAPITEQGARGHSVGDRITLRSTGGGQLLLAFSAEGALMPMAGDRVELPVEPDARRAARMLSHPSAMQWRHPAPGLPAAMVLRAAETDGGRMRGPERLFTFPVVDHGRLPVVSLMLPEADLFDAERGLYVVGQAAMDPPAEVMKRYLEDLRWWKYPGNYHYRGKAWERKGLVQVIEADDRELLNTAVRVRINGQMTRGFPQKALRLLFDDPLNVPLFPDGEGIGAKALVLRAAGNDQVKAMMRDAVLQDLCAGLPFDVSRSNTCVVYINGAYWGVHHLRQRLDEKELARRYAIPAKQVAMLEIRMRKYEGDREQARLFEQLVARVGRWDGRDAATLDSIRQELDVEGFLTYMAAMITLGNRDWPGDNVKFWRYTGKPGEGKPLDGRWYFTMGDVDLGFGANHGVASGIFDPFKRKDSPLVVLFEGLMRSPELDALFRRQVELLVAGPLAPERMVQHIEARIALMSPEMARHTARWRKPTDFASWQAHAKAMRRYAEQRPAEVLRQLKEHPKP